jgi:hypothetical protein
MPYKNIEDKGVRLENGTLVGESSTEMNILRRPEQQISVDALEILKQ